MTLGYVDFEFDLPRFLLLGLAEQLDKVDSAQLAKENLVKIPEAQGVYQLLLDNRLVYIGKTDSSDGLNHRLNRHWTHIQHRLNLDPEGVRFKAARVFVFTAVDLEALLIDHYRKTVRESGVLAWNDSGFGSNDPGRQRDTTRYKDGHFDKEYPIDIDRELDLDLTNATTAAAVLNVLKDSLPYVFRFQSVGSRSRSPHKDLQQTEVSVSGCSPFSARSLVTQVVSALPSGWRAWKLPGRILLYKDDDNTYLDGEEIARSPS